MFEKVSVLAVCFAYASDRRMHLRAVPKDLKKVLNYAAWLGARTYLVSDFVPDSGSSEIVDRLGLSGAVGPAAGTGPARSVFTTANCRRPGQPSFESSAPKNVCEFAGRVAGSYVVVYYSGHATNKSIILPDGSKLSVLALHQHLIQPSTRGVCWILDGCELSGKSLRLPFFCRKERISRVMPHGLHTLPTIALSATFCGAADHPEEDESVVSVTDHEGRLSINPRSFITDENGSLFTSALLPLITRTSPTEWVNVLGELSRCCGYSDGRPMCLNLHAFVSDASLTSVPFWMRKKSVERLGKFWVAHR